MQMFRGRTSQQRKSQCGDCKAGVSPRVFEERNESEEKWLGTQQDVASASYASAAGPLARPPMPSGACVSLVQDHGGGGDTSTLPGTVGVGHRAYPWGLEASPCGGFAV